MVRKENVEWRIQNLGLAKYFRAWLQDNKHRRVAVLAVVLVVVFLLWQGFAAVFGNSFPSVDKSTYQAIFLSNDQVYFGKLQNYSREYIVLQDVYFLRARDSLQQADSVQDIAQGLNLNLVKIGAGLHGPQDQMFVSKEHILFWEDLREDSAVMQTIREQQ